MPYYCTVPRCTSMAGKAKNVSFHQFPRDVELARLWNEILKRGKPYTKYSKVCSLHFRPEDYTITSVGKNKGQWRTLRKDAIPSQNLPSDSPTPPHRRRSSGAWVPDVPSNAADPRMQQQIAQAIYLQTMLAMQVAANGSHPHPASDAESPNATFQENTVTIAEVEEMIRHRTEEHSAEVHPYHNGTQESTQNGVSHDRTSYKCELCSKCFKDPDVFILHKRTHSKHQVQHTNSISSSSNEKENLDANTDFSKQDTLKANPILANLLKSTPSTNQGDAPNVFDMNTIMNVENQIMQALAANMESYIRNLSSMQPNDMDMDDDTHDQNAGGDEEIDDQNSDENSSNLNSTSQNLEHIKDLSSPIDVSRNSIENNYLKANNRLEENNHIEANENCIEFEAELEESKQIKMNSNESQGVAPNCDSEDLDISKDSNNLVIDEVV